MYRSEWEQQIETFSGEMFKIAEWSAVAAALIVLGREVGSLLAEGFGWILLVVASLYVGTAVSTVIAWARFGTQLKGLPRGAAILSHVASGVFGDALWKITEAALAYLAR